MDNKTVPGSMRGLFYPIESTPELGDIKAVAPGIYWIRMPLPFALNHINLWLLDDAQGWTLVDTGVATEEVIDYWQQIFVRYFTHKPLQRVIVTHLHPDHVGLAGWLSRKFGVELCMSRAEYLLCRTLVADSHREAPEEALAFYRAAGFDEQAMDIYRAQFGSFGKYVKALPNSYRRLADDDKLTIGGDTWQVVIGHGHSPEHVCLHCPSRNLLISGDQLLPTISSNVSVRPYEPHANPLKGWLDSCAQLRERLPEDVLVLPAHGAPFIGAQQRLGQLIDGHELALGKLHAYCATPQRATDVFSVLFKRPVDHTTLIFATGESLAHINCLIERGLLSVKPDSEGVNYYCQVK